MGRVTIDLHPETEQRLKERAKQGGQTLEAFLQQLMEQEARNGNLLGTTDEEPDEQLAARPWRGLFAPPRQRAVLFSKELAIRPEQLPKRRPAINLSWLRPEADDE